MRAAPFLATLLLLTVAVPLASIASAADPCGTPDRIVRLSDLVLGLHTKGCVGAYVGLHALDCVQVPWGVMTDVAGVGGGSPCEASAYVHPGGVATLLP